MSAPAQNAPASQHDDPNVVVGGGGLHRVAHIALHDRGPRSAVGRLSVMVAICADVVEMC
jgi:hypothetical protein